MRRLTIVLLTVILSAAAAAEEAYTEVIQLQSRLPEEVVPVIRPLVGPDGSVSAFGGRLVVRAAPERMDEILRVLGQVDRPPRRVVIHVRHSDVHQGSARSPLGLRDQRTLGETERSERIQTLDGRPAFIRAGESVPVPVWQAYGGGALPFVEQATGYRDAVAGFFVTPRLAGDEVILEIARDAVQAGPGPSPRFRVGEAAATLRVRPGEWVTLGSVSGSTVQDGRGIVGQYATRRAEDAAIRVMVEVLPER
jgi:type II secretory pathway component GspD/PulD (secretin)